MELLRMLLGKVDVLPGKKTYILAGLAALAYYLNLLGILPDDLTNKVVEWMVGGAGATVLVKLLRDA